MFIMFNMYTYMGIKSCVSYNGEQSSFFLSFEALDTFVEYSELFYLKIDYKKTKFLIFGTRGDLFI